MSKNQMIFSRNTNHIAVNYAKKDRKKRQKIKLIRK